MAMAKESLKTMHAEAIKLTQLAELGQAAEKGFEEIKNSISCKGTNTYLGGFCVLIWKNILNDTPLELGIFVIVFE